MDQNQPKKAIKRAYCKKQKPQMVFRSESEKMRQLLQIIDENKRVANNNNQIASTSPNSQIKNDSEQQQSSQTQQGDKNTQNTTPTQTQVQPSAEQPVKQTLEIKIIKKAQPQELMNETQKKKIKPDENYEQRFCQMKCELQSFLSYWIMKLKSSVTDTQQMVEQLEKFKL
ncbi:unnamed protein product (macronuclear) [Paramecium tetraurelia]|uniref:Uncharacterized protein n=1 Tax=Paramecium tetraurelia TaxID=5888 RepID=A0BIL4_PARTE|nr:uncharacterized protein GSPATT00004753001 [Paramecium tetraurelia]CAK58381.1 unnamed protein product [Paramecium tetraurelia]|eukprot:XP_001425779.1 hypothetical protein (macronuclear) [Paramecium tetraurelia strain d4-2]